MDSVCCCVARADRRGTGSHQPAHPSAGPPCRPSAMEPPSPVHARSSRPHDASPPCVACVRVPRATATRRAR
eukprot:5006444-Pleurochrysis_carterae.AAC.1